MNTRWTFPGVVAASLVLGLLVGGCQQGTKLLVTGTVDTTKILQYDDEYQSLAKQYFVERVRLTDDLNKAVAAQGGEIRSQDTYNKFKGAELELYKRWLERTRKFTQSRMVKVTAAAEAVSKKKGLDLVVLDSKEFPTVEYGGVDITGDILAEMPGFAGGGGDKTEAKPSPEATR